MGAAATKMIKLFASCFECLGLVKLHESDDLSIHYHDSVEGDQDIVIKKCNKKD